jgi:putative ABC transport system substrate-binding protein
VDVIVVTSTREALVAKRATSTIPIVITVALDPVGDGLVASLARPGGNVTGNTGVVPGVSQKFVELLHQLVPPALRFAVITSPTASSEEMRRELQTSAQPAGLALSFIEVRAADDIDRALQQAKNAGAEGIIAPLGAVTYSHRAQLVRLALEQRLPGVYWHRDFVEAGGLMSYGPNALELAVRSSYYVDKILKGAKPAELPVEQPTKFELVINLKTAMALRLAIPQSLLLRADEVIR